MKYLKGIFEDNTSDYKSKINYDLVHDLIDLSMDLIDLGLTINIQVHFKDTHKMFLICYDHNTKMVEKFFNSFANSYEIYEENEYHFSYSNIPLPAILLPVISLGAIQIGMSNNKIWKDVYNNSKEIESIIREMYPDEKIRLDW